MSDLKYQTLEELETAKEYEQNKINYHGSQKSGAETRLSWIEHYITIKKKGKL